MCTLTQAMLTKPKTSGAGTVVKFRRRQQKRNPRRPLEAVQADWDRWDAGAKLLGLNWSEFTRRALNAHANAALSGYELGISPNDFKPLPVSEKGSSKNGAAARPKPAAKRAARKG